MKPPAKTTPLATQAATVPRPREHAGFRRLAWNELVGRGDYAADHEQRLQPWEGPTGFRASSFVKTIYRKGRARQRPPVPAAKAVVPPQ